MGNGEAELAEKVGNISGTWRNQHGNKLMEAKLKNVKCISKSAFNLFGNDMKSILWLVAVSKHFFLTKVQCKKSVKRSVPSSVTVSMAAIFVALSAMFVEASVIACFPCGLFVSALLAFRAMRCPSMMRGGTNH